MDYCSLKDGEAFLVAMNRTSQVSKQAPTLTEVEGDTCRDAVQECKVSQQMRKPDYLPYIRV